MARIQVKEYEDITKSLRRFKKAVKADGVMDRLRELSFYEKPTTKRKRAKAAAKARWRKKEKLNQLPKKPGEK